MSSNMEGPPARRPHPGPMSATYLEFDLAREIDDLQREAEWATGRNARTLVKYDDLRVVLTVLKAGARIPGHQTAGRISIQGLRGRIRLHAEGRTFDVLSGVLLALDRAVPHDLEAVDDSAFLLTIAWPPADRTQAA